jgi:lantibiotic biosynthesis protein
MSSTTRSPRLTSAQSLGRGAAGIALLHIERARTGRGSWTTAHEHVVAMTRSAVVAHGGCSLFQGAPAVAYVLHLANQTAYANALATLDAHIDRATRERLRRAHERIDHGRLPALREFDLISGLTGLGVYQLHRHGSGELLEHVLRYVVRLCEPLSLDGIALPGWWTGNDTADYASEAWPGGHGNLGIAHGIGGPLALMASAARRGIHVPGQTDAIRSICSWLDQWQKGDGTAAWWPGTISMSELESGTLGQSGPQRPSWCYGTPGIARAQQVAGLALGDQARQHQAEATLLGCITDHRQLDQLDDASLCHGWAGLVQTTWRAVADADPGSSLANELPRLVSHLEEIPRPEDEQKKEELLEGATGVYLTQITATPTVEHAPAWDTCLLLTG